jgi:putative oxidoreductase
LGIGVLVAAIRELGSPIGLFTRPVAFVLTGHMAVIFWWRHACGNPIWPLMNRGETSLLFCFMFLLIWAWGGGTWSVDAWRERRSSEV